MFLEACAGRRVPRLCPPAVACSAGCVPARLCHAMPTALLNVLAPVHFALLCPLSIPCAPGSSSQDPTCLQAARLSRRQQQRGSAVVARAPCCVHHTVTGAARLPVGSRTIGTAFGQPMRRCPLRRKTKKRGGGRPRTACGQPARFPTPAFCEPETAREQPGSLLTFFFLHRVR